MEKEKEWYQITLNEPSVLTNQDDRAIFVREIEGLYEKEGAPEDFCVFQETNETHDLVFYFNPAARDWCNEHGLFDANEGHSRGNPVSRVSLGLRKGPITCVVGPYDTCQWIWLHGSGLCFRRYMGRVGTINQRHLPDLETDSNTSLNDDPPELPF